MAVVSTVLRPVGPEPPEVYWRRRLLVGLAILVALIIIVVMFWPGGGTSSNPVPTGSPTATASTSPSPSGSTSESAGVDCSDSDIRVTAEIPKTSYEKGATIQFYMLIANTSDRACKRNVGPRVNSFKVTSGGEPVWDSDDCNPTGGDQIETIPQGGAFKVAATWNQTLTSPGCPSGMPKAQPGAYSAVAKNLNVPSKPLTFAIT